VASKVLRMALPPFTTVAHFIVRPHRAACDHWQVKAALSRRAGASL